MPHAPIPAPATRPSRAPFRPDPASGIPRHALSCSTLRRAALWVLLACSLIAWPTARALAAPAPSAAQSASRPAPAAPPVPVTATTQRMLDTSTLLSVQPLAPFMEFLIDPTGSLTVDELLSPSHQAGFAPLGGKVPLTRAGSTWLRMTLAPRQADGQSRQLLLDLGRDLPGKATLFLSKRNQPGEPHEWQPLEPEGANLFNLPDPVGQPVPVYVRLDGVPGPWFAPMLRTASNAAANNDELARPLAIGALAAVLGLCLLRSLAERGEWRLWTSLFAAAVLVQAVTGQPPTPAGYVPLRGLPGVLAPGLALMLLPHVGRHLLRTRESAPGADLQLRLTSLVGAMLALVPLVPGMAWTSRLLALWPLLLVLVLPAAGLCVARKTPGARRFLAGCLAALVGAGIGLAGMGSPAPAVWVATAPMWGLALLALLVAGTAAPRPKEAEGALTGGRGYRVRKSPAAERPDLDDPLADEPALRLISSEELRGTSNGRTGRDRYGVFGAGSAQDGGLTLNTSDFSGDTGPSDLADLTDPADHADSADAVELSLGDVLPELDDTLPPRRRRSGAAMRMQPSAPTGEDDLSASPSLPGSTQQLDPLALARMEEALLVPVDAMLQELDGLENCALPPAARSHAEAVAAAGRDIAALAADLSRVAMPRQAAPRRAVFDLQRMLRDAHDAVADLAERKGLALSWFMAPHLSQLYEGSAAHLGELLRLLTESSVRSTDKGSVHMSVRRVPDSTDPGHLLFTVSDSGAGAPPRKRSISALARAWEMADAAGGTLTVESGRGQGTTISFTARLVALSGDATAPRPFVGVDLTDDLRVARPTDGAGTAPTSADQMHLGPVPQRRSLQVIVADDVPSSRQLLSFYLEGLPHTPLEARGATEAGILYRRAPSGLVIMDGDMPEDDVVAAVASIRAFEQEHDMDPVPVLALVANDEQAERLLSAGCTETLEKPLTRSGLRAAVERLAPLPVLPLLPTVPPVPSEEEPVDSVAAPWQEWRGEPADSAAQQPEHAATHAPDTAAGYQDALHDFAPMPDLFLAHDGHETGQITKDAEDTTQSWHPWDRPAAPEAPAISAPTSDPVPDETTPQPAAPDEREGAESLPDLFGVDIFAVSSGSATPSAHAPAPASIGVPLTELIIADAHTAHHGDAAVPGTATVGTAAPESPRATGNASQAGALTENAPPADAWGNDFEESVGEPVPVARTPREEEKPRAHLPNAAGHALAGEAANATTGDGGEQRNGVAASGSASAGGTAPAGSVSGVTVTGGTAPSSEWVGDPMPMEPHRAATHAGSSASSSYGAAARLERWERAQRAKQQGQQGQQGPRDIPPPPAAGHAPAQPHDPRPVRDLSAEVRPGYRGGKQPATQVAPPATVTPEERPTATVPPSVPPLMPTGMSTVMTGPASPVTSPATQPRTAPQESPPAAAVRSLAERIAGHIASHLGKVAGRGERPETRTAGEDAARKNAAPPDARARSGEAPRAPSGPQPSAPASTGRDQAGHMDGDLEPLIPGLLEALDAALEDARKGRAQGSTFAVQEAAARIAGKAASFGLRILERIARCVERAAAADDMEAVRDLLPELEAAVERNRIALAPRTARRGGL